MLTAIQTAALKSIAEASVESEKLTQLPAELSVAQCIFESAWLTRCPGNNCFGIKADQHGSGIQYVMTEEYINGMWKKMSLAFEKYDSLADCFDDHARLIIEEPVYKSAWTQYQQDHNLDAFIKGVAVHYATAPTYYTAIDQMAHTSYVTQAIATARSNNA